MSAAPGTQLLESNDVTPCESSLAERLARLEARVLSLEADRQKLLNAFVQAAKMAMASPMAAAMMPKEVREGLKKYVAEQS